MTALAKIVAIPALLFGHVAGNESTIVEQIHAHTQQLAERALSDGDAFAERVRSRQVECATQWDVTYGAGKEGEYSEHEKALRQDYIDSCAGGSDAAVVARLEISHLRAEYYKSITPAYIAMIERIYGDEFLKWFLDNQGFVGQWGSDALARMRGQAHWVARQIAGLPGEPPSYELSTPAQIVAEAWSRYEREVLPYRHAEASSRADFGRVQSQVRSELARRAELAMPASFIRTLEDFAAQHDLGIYDPSSGAIQIGLLDNGLDPLVTAIGFEGSQVPQGWIEGEYFVAEVLAEYGLGAPPSLVRPAEQSFSALDSLAALAGNGEWQGPVKPTTAHFDQRFIHGILSNSNFALEAWVRSLGGDPGDRLDWRSDAAYTMHQRWMFEREARRLAYSVIESRREAGEARPLLLHGHSAGGVMASEVARILTEEGIPIAGMVTYGTPRDRLRFFTGIPPKLPVLALENQGDEILYLDGAGPNKAPNVRVVSFPDSVSVGAFDHPMADYTLDPNVNREVNQFAGSLLGSQKLGADTGPELSPARLKPQPNLTSGSLREVGGIVSRLVVEGQAAAPELANVALGDVMESWRRTGIGWVGLTGIVSDITVFNSETVVRLQTALGVDGVVQETPFGLSMSRGVNLLARIPAVAIKDRYFIDLPELDAESLESMDWEWK